MSWKVKRGLGLLVVAVIGWLVGLALINAPVGGATGVLVVAALFIAAIAAIGGLIAGLGLLAWGLLRD